MFLHIPDITVIFIQFSTTDISSKDTEERSLMTQESQSKLKILSSSIFVFVRSRPLSTFEIRNNSEKTLRILDGNSVIIGDHIAYSPSRINRKNQRKYVFDHVFDDKSNQNEVFNLSTKYLIENVINGFNATVFAYGATGAGKTYTMLGDDHTSGVIQMAFVEIFKEIQERSHKMTFNVRMSYLEIYNEVIKDLINPSTDILDIREDPIKGISVTNLAEFMATSLEEVIEYLNQGNRRRTTEPTLLNQTSSRSHAILQILIESKDNFSVSKAEITCGKLSLVDLAGSEKASKNSRGIRIIEGSNINKSLLALGNCVKALCELNDKGGKIYIPYRNSKLTRLLKDSLGGNCKTAMIACISPHVDSYTETLNTLKYANRAKNVKTYMKQNVINVSNNIANYTTIIAQLRQETISLRDRLKKNQKNESHEINNIRLEINKHFQLEAKMRKKLLKTEKTKDEVNFILFSKQ